jgi:cyclopropane-fatty-acyl-phospholipid synthase
METNTAKTLVLELAEKFDLKEVIERLVTVHDERVYARILRDRNLGIGESYMEGWWDCEAIDEVIYHAQRAQIGPKMQWSWWSLLKWSGLYAWSRLVNLQTTSKSLEVGASHYDLGEELYARMLDSRMIYSCGYWKDATTLDEAQTAKLDLVCRKLGLESGMKVLDIGCGWGGFARYAAETYGVEVLGITISKSQLRWATDHNSAPHTEFQFLDYRDLLTSPRYEGYFDRVVSIGMIEHVGVQNYATFMQVVDYVLISEGLALVHTIGGRQPKLLADPWFNKYIFPNSVLPTLTQLSAAVEHVPGNPFVIEDVHNFGSDYDKTLMCWYENFMRHLPAINAERATMGKSPLDDVFVRMWRYYLLCSAGLFRARDTELYQIVLSKGGVLGGYQRVD